MLIKKRVINSSTYSAKKIWFNLNENDISVGWRTDSRRLVQEIGLKSRKPAKKAEASLSDNKEASPFCTAAQDWACAQYYEVLLFSDESTVQQFAA